MCTSAREFTDFLGFKPTGATEPADVGDLSERLEHMELQSDELKEQAKSDSMTERQRESALQSFFFAVGMWWLPILVAPTAAKVVWAFLSDSAWLTLEPTTIGWRLLNWLWPILVCKLKFYKLRITPADGLLWFLIAVRSVPHLMLCCVATPIAHERPRPPREQGTGRAAPQTALQV